jgi:hypothetical protein
MELKLKPPQTLKKQNQNRVLEKLKHLGTAANTLVAMLLILI